MPPPLNRPRTPRSRAGPATRVVADSYHEIHLSHPDVVVAAIGDVVAAVRAKAPLQ